MTNKPKGSFLYTIDMVLVLTAIVFYAHAGGLIKFTPQAALAHDDETETVLVAHEDDDKITICHKTQSDNHPYNIITVDRDGLNGHGDHDGDIVPAPESGCPAPSPTPTPTPAPAPSCPFLPQTGRTIAVFSGDDKIVSNRNEDKATKGPVSISLSAGTYKVSLASFDSYADRVNASQPHESWLAKLGYGSTVTATTNSIDDLTDNVETATKAMIVNESMILENDITFVTATHAFFPDESSPNSVVPVCASFDLIAPTPTPTPTPSPTPTPTPTTTPTPTPSSSCSFEPQAGRTIVVFSGENKIVSNGSVNASTKGPVEISLPIGTYKVSLYSFDGYTDRVNVSQPNEKWFVTLKNGTTTVANSNSINDLADNVASASLSMVVNEALVLTKNVTSVTANHAVYPDNSSPNSVYPVCAAFDVVAATPSPTPTPTPTPTPISACSDNSDNDADGLIDALDPGCHSDGNVNNSSTYVPTDNDESNPTEQCRDGKDNDSDSKIDSLDPGCHSDGNTTNASTYVPTDNDEVDVAPTPTPTPTPTNNGGGGGGGGSPAPTPTPTPTFTGGNGPVNFGIVNAPGQVLGADTYLPPSCTEYLHEYIKLGRKNNPNEVIKLQTFLNRMGANLPVTGFYGPLTYNAVKLFQVKSADQVLIPWIQQTGSIDKDGTGFVYKTTKRWINMIMCPALNIPMPQLP